LRRPAAESNGFASNSRSNLPPIGDGAPAPKRSWIAVIDADNFTLPERLAQLDQKLREDGVELIRMDVEQVARLIPRRNIETWILCLNAVGVNEETDYKRTRNDWTELIRPAAETLYTWARPNTQVPDNCIPSLQHGVAELRRLDFSEV
jgi:hypothetical protein